MGAWGPGIFSDDLAADVRDEWREAILGGADAAHASESLIGRYREESGEPVFWIALAAAQMETGRLQPDVRDRALALIDGGAALDPWEGAGARARRERVLRRLAQRLRGPQPAPKTLRGPRPGPHPGVEEGDVVRLWNAARSRSALFAVTGLHEYRRQRWPTLLGLYWDGGAIPDAAGLAALPYLSSVDPSAFEGDEPPEHLGVAFPFAVTVMVVRRGDELRGDRGEVVAHGVERHEDWDAPARTMTTWEGVAAELDGRGFDLALEVTRRRLARYGDDPHAWRREREELFGSETPLGRAFGLHRRFLRAALRRGEG